MGSSRKLFSAHSKGLIKGYLCHVIYKFLFVYWPREPNVYGIMLNMILGDSTKYKYKFFFLNLEG